MSSAETEIHPTTKCPFPTPFVVWNYLLTSWILAMFILRGSPKTFGSWIFAGAIILSYALIYSLPTILAIWATSRARRRGGIPRSIGAALVILITTFAQLLIISDYVIHGMFGFHINGFVINLVSTPEGMASMGAGSNTELTYVLITVGAIALNVVLWWISLRKPLIKLGQKLVSSRMKLVLISFVILSLGERITFGVAHIQAWSHMTGLTAMVPGYQPFTFRSLAKKLGFEMKRSLSVDAPKSDASLVYPLNPLTTTTPQKPLNMVWFVCESLRADVLNPEIMPKTWALAQESQHFTHHYSGGNGTRMGVFGAFYGLPGSYWFNFLRDRRSPVLVDRLQELDYKLRFSTSAAFSYPEFDKTILAHVPEENLHPLNKHTGWISDRHHTGEIKKWLKTDQSDDPFFLFHFFESPHASYTFPDECAIRESYLDDLNYATVDLEEDIELIRNRYLNAVYHLDTQIGELVDALREKNQLENTIILITGDHGEEFMENGRWGHNSAFTEHQVRVPLVVYMPGREPAIHDHPTCHADLAPTFVPMLGVTNPTSDYSTGTQLFSPAPRLLTFSDWDRIAISDSKYKVVFPLGGSVQIGAQVSTAQDEEVDDEGAVIRTLGAQMVQLKNMMSRFTRKF